MEGFMDDWLELWPGNQEVMVSDPAQRRIYSSFQIALY